MTRYRLGCDVGGTFTDFVLLDMSTGSYELAKVLTTPDDPSLGIDEGVAQFAEGNSRFIDRLESVVHGTTLVINAILERKGAVTGLITTKGFRDILEMRREIRYDAYDLNAGYPTPIIERRWRREVDERVASDGQVRRALDPGDVRLVLQGMVEDGVESVAVVLIHAYRNGEHEELVREIAGSDAPFHISLSSEVHPELREFERTSATVLNAYVKPLVDQYLARIEERLAARGFDGALTLVLSGGGITSVPTARKFPVRLIESGPVGGAIAATNLALQAGFRDLVTFDMGGTTAKATLVRNGQLAITKDLEVDRVHRFKTGSGTPVAVPSVDIVEIGAGGGSVARVGSTGILEVGPESTGAMPGPICYGRGGASVSVTDADLILGYLDAAYFLGGAMTLDVDGARRGIEQQVAEPLGMGQIDAAWGVYAVVTENMAGAVRMYVAERGGDLSSSLMVAFGGAGPVHAYHMARSLGIREVLIPRAAGVLSAMGFLAAPVAYEASRSHQLALADLRTDQVSELYGRLETEAATIVERAAPALPITYARAADMRYLGQLDTIRVEFGEGGELDSAEIKRHFEAAYRELYGLTYDDQEIQLVNLITVATAGGITPELSIPFPAGPPAEPLGGRLAFDPESRSMIKHDVYHMDDLTGGTQIAGPAIVEEAASTTIIGRDGLAVVDARGWLLISIGQASSAGPA